MPGRFEGRRVLITGASAGIGRAAAVAFAGEGARIVAVARSRERLDGLAERLGGPPAVATLVADVADAASMGSMAARALAEGGPPDVIVANAGIGLDARFQDTTDEAVRAVFEVNVFGVFRTIRPFLPGMVERGSGRIVVVSSIVGKRGVPHYSAYSASKFALHGMADALRPELLGTGVTVGIVCPASTASEFHERKLRHGPPQKRVRAGSHSPESVARAIVDMAGSRRRERVLTPEGKALAWANALVPGLLDRLLARMLTDRR